MHSGRREEVVCSTARSRAFHDVDRLFELVKGGRILADMF
jgi:hypothetical protein